MQYKRKFLVPGDTVRTCRDLCKDPHRAPCKEAKDFTGRIVYRWIADITRCIHPNEIDKPREYIVSETVEGEWQCSCKAWTTHKPRIDCKHIYKAKANPEKYEVDVNWTGKTLETIKKVTG